MAHPLSSLAALAPQACFLGLDLTSNAARASAYALVNGKAQPLELGFLGSDQDILAAVERSHPHLVAIDAPLSLPRGLHCLEEECPCVPLAPWKGRVCERELARRGIGCYFTTKRSIIKAMVCRAMKLKDELERLHYPAIEIYPYASKVVLWGRRLPRKNTRDGLLALHEGLSVLMPELTLSLSRPSHDLYDALIAAYTAYLHSKGQTEALGDPEEGVIYIPSLSKTP